MGGNYKNKKIIPSLLVTEVTMIVSSALKHCLRLKFPHNGRTNYLCSGSEAERGYSGL